MVLVGTSPGGNRTPGRGSAAAPELVAPIGRLTRIESFGWGLVSALRPYLLLVVAGSATFHLVVHPSMAATVLGGAGAAGAAASTAVRWLRRPSG